MSTSCGACGAYGILLSEVDLPVLGKIRPKLDEIKRRYAEDLGDYTRRRTIPRSRNS